MLYSDRLQDAIRFMLQTHEIHQKQKRRGKDIPYLAHPLTVGLILSRAGASEDVVIAGILHDTIEDSIDEKKVTYEALRERFGEAVAELVASVTEDRSLKTWDERKAQAHEAIASYGRDSLMLKSADVIANCTELIDDYASQGDAIFAHFTADKETMLAHHVRVIEALSAGWPESPIADDLRSLQDEIARLANT